jgi:hypothetical protein
VNFDATLPSCKVRKERRSSNCSVAEPRTVASSARGQSNIDAVTFVTLFAMAEASTFTVELNEGSEDTSRAARRLILNSDYLKAARLCTGDIVILSNGDVRFPFTYHLL